MVCRALLSYDWSRDELPRQLGKVTSMSEGQIRVECDCGKAARVPARFAGRQVKCGGCGSALRIPDPDDEDEDEDDYEDEDEGEGEDLRAKAPQRKGRTRTGRSRPGGAGRATGRKGAGSRVGSRVGKKKTGSRVGKRASGTGRVGAGRRRRSSEDDDADPYAPSRAVLRDGPKGRGRSKGRGRGRGGARLLSTEGHICAIGIWNVIWGLFAGLAGLFMVASGGALGGAMGGAGGGAIGSAFAVIGVVLLLMGGASIGIGVGLMKRQSWARIGYTVVTGLGLLAQAFTFVSDPGQGAMNIPGLAYTAAIFMTLYGQNGSKVFSRGYLDSIRGDRRSLPWASSPFFWIPLVLICLGFLAGVLIGLNR
jgi:hypothetical protein